MKRSAAAIAAAQHWTLDAKKSKKEQVAVEVLSQSSDTDNEDKLAEKSASTVESVAKSAIRLFYLPSSDLHDDMLHSSIEDNKDTVTFNELVGTKDLEETFQFNFSIDVPLFVSYLHPEFVRQKRKITLITGSQQLNSFDAESKKMLAVFNLHEVVADVTDRFGSHHTKMMINFFEDQTCEVVIMTCNITKLDIGGLSQMCWRSGRLPKGTTNANCMGTLFQRDLNNYLLRYKKQTTNRLAKKMSQFDFSTVNVELVASTPGYFDLNDVCNKSEVYGYGKLQQVLKRNGLLIQDTSQHHSILAQVSSIAYPLVSERFNTSSIFTHLLCPLVFNSNFKVLPPGKESAYKHQESHKYTPSIIFPTAGEISRANVGFGAGLSIHFNYTRSHAHINQYKQNIQPYLKKWGSKEDLAGRNDIPPHVKLYACDDGNGWKTLKWVLLCSHNLSKQAWGAPISKDGKKYKVASYELGILVPGTSELSPCYKRDSSPNLENPIRLPFALPPEPYGVSEQPWSPQLNFGSLEDRFGNKYKP